jgi:hypothetical protein
VDYCKKVLSPQTSTSKLVLARIIIIIHSAASHTIVGRFPHISPVLHHNIQ